jgi:hypothetical protein
VPKVPKDLENAQLNQTIANFKEKLGSGLDLLDTIVQSGSASVGGRYTVLNFFMKFLYSSACDSEQKKKIATHMTTKQAQYT